VEILVVALYSACGGCYRRLPVPILGFEAGTTVGFRPSSAASGGAFVNRDGEYRVR
jgi:hypothetical protein